MHQTLQAALWMTGAIASFSSMAVAGRAIASTHDTFELMFYRSLVGILVVVITARFVGTLRQVSTRRIGVHLIRNVMHFAGQNLWFYAITLIPLAQVFALEFTSPLWVTLFAPLLLGERLSRTRAMAATLGFIGILLVAQPDFGGPANIGVLSAALAAVGFAGSAIFTKLLTRTESITCILFWLTVMQAIFGLIMAGWDGDLSLPTAGSAPWLVLVGLAGLLAHFCLTKALSLAPAVVVMPVDFLRLPVIAVIGYLFYGEPVTMALVAGAAIIISANFINIRAEAATPRSAPPASL
jgi:drug/metabolite transporter (DMT)-like permease